MGPLLRAGGAQVGGEDGPQGPRPGVQLLHESVEDILHELPLLAPGAVNQPGWVGGLANITARRGST